jgi:hypothetical protein
VTHVVGDMTISDIFDSLIPGYNLSGYCDGLVNFPYVSISMSSGSESDQRIVEASDGLWTV